MTSRGRFADSAQTALFEWPSLPRSFRCPNRECANLPPYRSQSGLSVHRRARHGEVSDSKWAIQKREVRQRKRDPANAPPRRRPGPPPGQPKNRLCMQCRADLRAERRPPAKLTLPFGDVEFIRKRMLWAIDQLAAKLTIDLAADDTAVRDAIWYVLGNKLAPPQIVRNTVNAAAAFGTSGERSSSSWLR